MLDRLSLRRPDSQPRPGVALSTRTVDDRIACQLFQNCHYPVSGPNRICDYHITKLRALVKSKDLVTTKALQLEPCNYLNMDTIAPDRRDFIEQQISLLQQYKLSGRAWVVDVEELMSPGNGYAAMSSQLGVVNVFDQSKAKKFHVNWNDMTVQNTIDHIFSPQFTNPIANAVSRKPATAFFSKQYKKTGSNPDLASIRTFGATIPEIREEFRNLGVDEADCLIGAWGNGH